MSKAQAAASASCDPLLNVLPPLSKGLGSAALKVIAVPKPPARREQIQGILLSLDGNYTLVSGRILLVKVEETSPERVGVRIAHQKEFEGEAEAIIQQIRNEVRFQLVDKVFHDGRLIEQDALVSLTAKMMHDNEGRPMLTDEKGGFFSPAAHERYPFNSALTVLE